MVKKFCISIILVGIYGFFFIGQEKISRENRPDLPVFLPANVVKVGTGYLRQLVAEFYFIRTSVFLGGSISDKEIERQYGVIGNNLEVITDVYEEFIDPYYFTQAFLGSGYTELANRILEHGIEAHPQEYILYIFAGYNYLRHLDAPEKAAVVYNKATKQEGAPSIFQNLAITMSARGGNIVGAIISLRALVSVESDPIIVEYYNKEIENYEKALKVEKSLQKYFKDHNRYPSSLDELIPDYISEIPHLSNKLELNYKSPHLSVLKVQ